MRLESRLKEIQPDVNGVHSIPPHALNPDQTNEHIEGQFFGHEVSSSLGRYV